jgi:uroporphyrinogen III methyltransferase/synthase
MSGERKNRVYLVGAGPGDPGLMTARALELIAFADVIYYDRLIPPTALDGAKEGAEKIYVGKQPGVPSVPQEEIAAQLVESGREGLNVVRLKGGDPFLFGRGAEEAEALRAAGLDFEVVPGVTAGIAATAYAGIPVTHRDDASAVAFVTGHEDPAKPETALDWNALAAFPGTLVFYMGVKRLAENASALIEAGRPETQPAAAIESGTTPGQRVVTATLGTIAETVAGAGIKPPALIVIGEVARQRDRLRWFEDRPLHGRKVVVTRARAQASGFAKRLRRLGAEVIELPVIRIESLIGSAEAERTVNDISKFELVCLTSPNGAHLLLDALARRRLDARALAGAKVAAIGPGTVRALAEHGLRADIVPERFVAESLIEALEDVEVDGRNVLVARAEEARDVLPDALRERGAEVTVLPLYRTVREDPGRRVLAAAEGADWVTFTSASTVRNLTEAMPGGLPAGARIVSIGPVTSAAAREAGVEVAVEAGRHDLDGLLEALLEDAGKGDR